MTRAVMVSLCALVAGAGAMNTDARAHASADRARAGSTRTAYTASDTSAIRDSAVALELRFLAQWDTAWRFSERDRHQFATFAEAGNEDGTRHANYHCHPEFRGIRSAALQGRIITASRGWFAVCPSFDLGDIKTPVNERMGIDQSLVEERREAIRIARARVLATLDTAARALPNDDLIIGQRVRLLVDQGELGTAVDVARACTAQAWWCSVLAGYVFVARNEVLRADSAFNAAFAAMPREQRCEWTDHRALFAGSAQDSYESVSCERRAALNERMWWLADPLYIEAGNEREVEQYARAVLLALRTALGRDERYAWDTDIGSDARRAMIVRYGWPSYVFWGGPLQDRSHSGYLATNMSRPNEPYTTYEYFGSRVHAIPEWRAIERPFEATAKDWTMTAFASRERNTTPVVPGVVPYWWPTEHFEPQRPLVQLPSGQNVMLRRQHGALLAIATDLLPRELARKSGNTITGIVLVRSERPHNVERMADAQGVVGGVLTLHAEIAATPAVFSVEFAAATPKSPPGARLRFGATPPAPLATMIADELAVSEPVLLRVPTDDASIPNDPSAALALMATTHTVPRRGKFGVYWETYGFAPADSVEIAVWVERATSQSIVRRFGIVLGVATDLNTPVATSWREPDAGRRAFVSNDGGVPIIGRSIVIDLSAVPAGEYRLEIAARKPGRDVVRGKTTFTVR